MISAKKLFSKTLPFVWAKLLLGLAFVLVAGVLLGIFVGLGWLFGDVGMIVMVCLWFAALGVLRFVMMHYFGYLIKAGHIAVIAEATATGVVPDGQLAYGKNKVKERFATSNVYFAVDKLVSAAVKEIQKGIGKIGDLLDFLPGMEAVTSLVQFFVNISLGYIDECCLGWTFRNPNQGAFKSAADGVVLYAQNWKALLKGAAKTMLKTLLLCVLVVLLIFVPVALIFRLFQWSLLLAFVIACLLTWVAKFAFMDSYIMISMMHTYMQVASSAPVAYDLYGKLSGISGKFKQLFQKGREEEAQAGAAPAEAPAYAAPAQGAPVYAQPETAPQAAPMQKVFCSQCGTANAAGVKFCSHCGAKME